MKKAAADWGLPFHRLDLLFEHPRRERVLAMPRPRILQESLQIFSIGHSLPKGQAGGRGARSRPGDCLFKICWLRPSICGNEFEGWPVPSALHFL